MSDKDSMYMFPKSLHPSVYDTLQGARFQTRSRGSLQYTPRGSLVGSRTVTDREPEHYSYTRRTNMKSEYIGLKRPVNDGSRLYQSYLWDENKLKSHVERLVNVKPKVDCGAPNVNSTELFNMQKIRDWNRRKQKLDYENKTIVGRLSDIMSNGRSDLDCWNPACYKPDGSYYKREARKKRERENSFILERLMSVPPSVDSHRLHLLNEHRENTKYKNHMRKYPILPTKKIPYSPSRTRSDLKLPKI